MIRALLPIPFVEKGRDRRGCDCWGIVLMYYKWKFDVDLPKFEDVYLKYKYPENGVEDFREVVHPMEQFTEISSPDQDDIVVLNVHGRPVHVGVMIDCQRFIHTYKGSGVCIESIDDQNWQTKIESFHRWSNK